MTDQDGCDSDASTTSTEEVSGQILTLTVHSQHPATAADITCCRVKDEYISPIDALEVYKPCTRRTATKLWNDYKKSHDKLQIKTFKLIPPYGKRRVKTECVTFEVISDLLKVNKDTFSSFQEDQPECKLETKDIPEKKEGESEFTEIPSHICENPEVAKFMLASFKHEALMKTKEIEIRKLELQLKKKEYEYKTAFLQQQHMIRLAEKEAGIYDSSINVVLREITNKLDKICVQVCDHEGDE